MAHEKIDAVYAFIATDEGGSEGIPAFVSDNNLTIPMIGADMDRVEHLRPIAEQMALGKGIIITLAKFGNREDLERFVPENVNGGEASG